MSEMSSNGASSRAASAGVPDPELVERAQRRRFTAESGASLRLSREQRSQSRVCAAGFLLLLDRSGTVLRRPCLWAAPLCQRPARRSPSRNQ